MEQPDMFDLGLQADLTMLKQSGRERRKLLKMGALGLGLWIAGCQANASNSGSSPTASSSNAIATGATQASSSSAACVSTIPGETAGPYPADGSNASNQKLNALALSGIVRSDIRTSLGTKNSAAGIPLTIALTLVNTNANCAPLANYALYLWHCNRAGDYSLYSANTSDEDYLRGVQATDSQGQLSFTSIFPGCYLGRWPHVHFEIYPSLAKATSSSSVVHTSQLALPEDICTSVYAGDGYSSSAKNLKQITLKTDNVFSDGYTTQMASVTGDATQGYTATLTVGVAI